MSFFFWTNSCYYFYFNSTELFFVPEALMNNHLISGITPIEYGKGLQIVPQPTWSQMIVACKRQRNTRNVESTEVLKPMCGVKTGVPVAPQMVVSFQQKKLKTMTCTSLCVSKHSKCIYVVHIKLKSPGADL